MLTHALVRSSPSHAITLSVVHRSASLRFVPLAAASRCRSLAASTDCRRSFTSRAVTPMSRSPRSTPSHAQARSHDDSLWRCSRTLSFALLRAMQLLSPLCIAPLRSASFRSPLRHVAVPLLLPPIVAARSRLAPSRRCHVPHVPPPRTHRHAVTMTPCGVAHARSRSLFSEPCNYSLRCASLRFAPLRSARRCVTLPFPCCFHRLSPLVHVSRRHADVTFPTFHPLARTGTQSR